jgi:hypothetical protein
MSEVLSSSVIFPQALISSIVRKHPVQILSKGWIAQILTQGD